MSDLDVNDSERPRKCRKIENNKDDVLRALLHEEIDIEIGLRTRLQETVESRLAWALVLQDVLEKQLLTAEVQVKQEGPNQFSDMAIAAYKAANTSSELFFPIEPPGLFSAVESQTTQGRANDPGRSPVQETHRSRHSTRPHAQLHHGDRVVKEPNKYLYLRDSTATPTMIYKIACPDCHRSDFPRLQGLLNHCRLKHQREFASHDECVQACAIVVPEEEQSFVMEHGLEVLGMSASLQRLFKMAVGAYEGIVTVSEAEGADEISKLVRPRSMSKGKEEKVKEDREEPAFVTKTLGHHKDTPALAPFLGRAPKKRQIHVYDGDESLDIISVDDNDRMCPWRMPHQDQESCIAGEVVRDDALSDDELGELTEKISESKGPLKAYEGSRFHIPLRLIISDHSLRLPEEAQSGGATHKWLLSVSTASYSLHMSTVLKKITVASASEPAPSTFTTPLSVTEPPFCVMGTADKSFLAQITLEWVGTRNKPTQVEHWVELHEGNSTRPIKGDEQVLDVELDRHTEVIPRRNDVWKVDWSTKVDKDSKPDQREEICETTSMNGPVPEWVQRLREIVQKFPMTAQDARLRKIPQVPYFLPLTTQHFLSLVEGRRKAIEWGRARAIWEDFKASTPEKDINAQDAEASDSISRILGPIDVYRWMKAEGLFLGGAPQRNTSTKPHRAVPDAFCGICGLRPSAHRKGKGGRTKDTEDGPSARVCERPSWVGRMPIMNAQDFLANQSQIVERRPTFDSLSKVSPSRLLEKIDPALVIGVRRVVSALKLPSFPCPSIPLSPGILPTKEDREAELMPYVVLTASLRALIHSLVCGGLQVIESKSDGSAKPSIVGSNVSHGSKKRLLVPVHILRGLVDGATKKGHRELYQALLLSMARLGVGIEDVQSPQPSLVHPEALVAIAEDSRGSDHKETRESAQNEILNLRNRLR